MVKFAKEYNKVNEGNLQAEGRKIASNKQAERLDLQKKALKQQFKTASYDIEDRIGILNKEKLEDIKKQKLARSHSISEINPKQPYTNQVRQRRNSSHTREL